MKIADMPIGTKVFAPLGRRVLAVLCRRVDGWCVYVDAVQGWSHQSEWEAVAESGCKQHEAVARAMALNVFHEPLDPGELPYAH